MNWDITEWHHSANEGWHADLLYGESGHVFVRDKEVWHVLFLIRYGA